MSKDIIASKDAKEPEKSVTDIDLDLDVESSTDVNARLLKESKKYKEKAASERARVIEMQAELDAIKKAELEKQGKEKERADHYQSQYETLKKTMMKKNLEDAVTAIATKAGCTKPQAVLQLGNRSALQYDETTGEVIGAESFVDAVRMEYPEFFSKEKKTTVNPQLPSTKVEDAKPDFVAKAIKGSSSDFANLLAKSSLMKAKQ